MAWKLPVKLLNGRSRAETPGLLERIGVRYFEWLRDASNVRSMPALEASDEQLAREARAITRRGMVWSFIVGAVSTTGSVYVEVNYRGMMPDLQYYAWLGGATLVLVGIELAILYLLALEVVHSLARLARLDHVTDDPALPALLRMPNLLARSAMEIPDPAITYLGIDPLRHASRWRLLLAGLLYRAKIAGTNALLKYGLSRVLGRSVLRISVAYAAVPATGLWNLAVLLKVARQARLRLFGYRLADYLCKEQLRPAQLARLSGEAQQACLMAAANTMVLTQRAHPNMVFLLARLSDRLPVEDGRGYDNWDDFLVLLKRLPAAERWFVLDLLSIAAAFDGRFSRLERRRLPEAFGEHTPAYFARIRKLRRHLLRGELHHAEAACQLDFQPG